MIFFVSAHQKFMRWLKTMKQIKKINKENDIKHKRIYEKIITMEIKIIYNIYIFFRIQLALSIDLQILANLPNLGFSKKTQ